MRLIALSLVSSFVLIGCGDSSTADSGTAGTGGSDATGGTGGGGFVVTLSHTYDPQVIDVAEETTDVCQSWVLDNDEPLYVRKIRQRNGGGWHH